MNQLLDTTEIPSGKIATDYEFLNLTPKYRNRVIAVPYSVPDKRWLDLHKQTLTDPEVSALLVPDYAKKEYLSGIKQLEKDGIFRKEFHACGYTLYLRKIE